MPIYSMPLLLLSLYLSVDYVQPSNLKDAHQFDLLIFTQFWPATVCTEWKEKNPSHSCAMPTRPDSWSIHGIWPTRLGTKEPSFCNRTWHFDPEQIQPIEAQMLQVWPNIEAETSTYALWSHEWTKHGTCAAALEPLNSELKYFSQGLDWLKKYNMLDILTAANIVPTEEKEYPITDINNAVVEKLGVRPRIECNKVDGKNQIFEIRICFNKTLDLADCDGTKYYDEFNTVLTNCDPSRDIYYPHNVAEPKHLYVQLYKLTSWIQWLTL
ncbi:ribonuclease Oy [Achroia grisella]|uniref:ribonuclease Oy n=1 Tax=Achroia grisella TaxID=688607 RepID=UPI0027D2CE88|nr:ribonuclease Oy [Achroia grisella]